MAELTAIEMAQIIGEYWGKNEGNDFAGLFSDEAIIKHPFFTKAVSPQTVVDVLNCTVCGTTTYDGFKLVSGSGDGTDDVIEMQFIDTGEVCGYNPQYMGRMVIKATIKGHRFTQFDVYGYDLLQVNPTLSRPFQKLDVRTMDSYELVDAIGHAWANNNMEMFLSLFNEGGTIYHPLFRSPITPEIAADVLNSAMKGISAPHEPKLITGDGSGECDVVDMFFDETGDQLGYLPDTMGVMHITAKIEGHRFKEFIVHGYTPAKSRFNKTDTIILPETQMIPVYQSAEKESTLTFDEG